MTMAANSVIHAGIRTLTTAPRPMSAEQARACIDAIRERVEDIRLLALDLYERQGWKALGYASWRDCVTKEFDRDQSYLYRQLNAALIEREITGTKSDDSIENMGDMGSISPIGEKSGSISMPPIQEGSQTESQPIPESQLRPLAEIPEGQRKDVWEESKATAPKGKVTAKHVQETVNQKLGKPKASKESKRGTEKNSPPSLPPSGKSKINGVLTEDPPDIARLRSSGKIAADVLVEINEPETGSEVETAGDADSSSPSPSPPLTDAEWFATLPVWDKLTPTSRVFFERDALAYRQCEEARNRFALAVRSIIAAANRRGKLPAYLHRLRSFLKVDHPKDWTLCAPTEEGGCGGRGILDLSGTCTKCQGCGYRILSW